MNIPLHLKPEDHSREADQQRVLLYGHMASLNPGGFRTPGKRSGPTRIERMARRVF